MEDVYEEVDEGKAEIEQLNAELRGKKNSLEILKKSHDALTNQIQEAKFKVEKLEQELLQKTDELRVDCDERSKKWEDENTGLVVALEEANEKVENQEQQIYIYRQEIESLKGLLSVSEEKSLETEKNSDASKELRERDDMYLKLQEENRNLGDQLKWKKEQFKEKSLETEKNSDASKELRERDDMYLKLQEENRNLGDQLKWKKEQFKHLEEAPEKLRDQFKSRRKEWESEKSTLFDDISSLQTKLDSQTRILNDLQHQLRTCNQQVNDNLDRANIELDERMRETSEMEFELRIWRSIVERLKNEFEDNHVMRKELETSLLAQVDFGESLKQEKDSLVSKLEEKEKRIDYLQKHVVLLEQELKVRETEASVSSETDKVRYLQIIEEKDKILAGFQKEVVCLAKESCRREFESDVIAKSCMVRTYEHKKENEEEKEKNMRIDKLMQQVTSLEEQFTSSLTSFSSQLAEKQAEINLVQEACDRITAAEILAALEIEEKKLIVMETEVDIHDIEQKLKFQEENWSQLEQLALDIEAEINAKQLKLKELTDQMETKLRNSDALLQQLKMGNRYLLERENLLGFVLGLGDKMCERTTADTKLIDMLRRTVQTFENDCSGMNLEKDSEFIVKDNIIMDSPIGLKTPETISEIRSPLKEINN